MGRHTVDLRWASYYPRDLGPVTYVDTTGMEMAAPEVPVDALSVPEVEELLPAGLSLWPRGAAWGTPDGEAAATDSRIAGLTRALLSPFALLYARAWRLTEESRAATLVDALPEWEADFGLPDPCVAERQTLAQRRTMLSLRVRSAATITPADVVRLAALLGYVVAVEEPDVFRCGDSMCGRGDEVSAVWLDLQWVVHVHNLPVSYFRMGESEVGVTRLLDFDVAPLACAIRRVSPAWTTVVFSVSPLAEERLLGTQDDVYIVTDDGRRIAVLY